VDDICDLLRWGQKNVFDAGKMHASTVPRGKVDMGSKELCSCLTFMNLGLMRALNWTGSLAEAAFETYLSRSPEKPYVLGGLRNQ